VSLCGDYIITTDGGKINRIIESRYLHDCTYELFISSTPCGQNHANHAHDLTRSKNKDIRCGLDWLAEAGYMKTSYEGQIN
jgi:hypothetical protein